MVLLSHDHFDHFDRAFPRFCRTEQPDPPASATAGQRKIMLVFSVIVLQEGNFNKLIQLYSTTKNTL